MHPGASHVQYSPCNVRPAEAESGIERMSSNTTNKSRFRKGGESSFLGLAEIVSGLNHVKSQKELDSAARRLIALAREARIMRDPEACEGASELVLTLDVSPKLRAMAEWYRSLGVPGAAADHDASRKAAARAMDNCDTESVPQILLAVGRSYHSDENYREALAHYIEVSRAARNIDILSVTQALWNIAMLEHDRGDHREALNKFERLFPVITALSHRYPSLYANYLNNLATLLLENGRTLESRQAIGVALASPLAARYPEWRETQKEIEEAARKESRKSAATLKISVAARTTAAPIASGAGRVSKQPRAFIFSIIGLVRARAVLNRRFSNHSVVSLLDRYVKTVRIRDRP
jgi:hypothetical protein